MNLAETLMSELREWNRELATTTVEAPEKVIRCQIAITQIEAILHQIQHNPFEYA